jgi:hypothetical protein
VIKLVQLVQVYIVEIAHIIPVVISEFHPLIADGFRRPHEFNRTIIEEQGFIVVATGSLGLFKLILKATEMLRVRHQLLIDHRRMSPGKNLVREGAHLNFLKEIDRLVAHFGYGPLFLSRVVIQKWMLNLNGFPIQFIALFIAERVTAAAVLNARKVILAVDM